LNILSRQSGSGIKTSPAKAGGFRSGDIESVTICLRLYEAMSRTAESASRGRVTSVLVLRDLALAVYVANDAVDYLIFVWIAIPPHAGGDAIRISG
jgi:hypothetical protein